MCGLSAIFAYGTSALPVDAAELARITESMAHRGPDGDGTWMSPDGRIGLGHRRLAILDPSPAGAQPMAYEGRLVITYNGEIYNFRELRAELEGQGRRFRTNSDTEVLLQLYDRDGEGFAERLRGMYAIALWDEPKQGLLLARDPFGIKPLYVADDGSTIRAASQVKALRAGGRIGAKPDAAGHVGFFLFGYVPEPHTLFADIRAVPAGTTEWIGCDGRRHTRRIDPLSEPAHPAADLRTALRASVQSHLVSDVPVGVFLSAGLDSTTIAALAAESHADTLQTLTLAFKEFAGSARDEAPLAEKVAAHYGTRQTTRTIEGGAFKAERDRLLQRMDQPTIDGVNTYFVAREASNAGLKVALSGLGGDELFGGYDTFRDVPTLVGGLGWIPGIGALGRAFRFVAGPLMTVMMPPKYAGLFEYASDYGSAYLLRRGLFMPWELTQVLDPEFSAQGFAALEPLLRLNATADVASDPRAKVQALETAWYMRNQLLRDADWAGMAHGVEIRTPLVDATLFRLVGRGGFTKRQMAETPAKPLPHEVLNRPKSGFFVPVQEWLGAKERGLRGWAREVYASQVA